ncbi:N-terminal EF-hand calcium-binding protein 1 isoform X2 [Phycodurus eques]|uniref:N-terminal EF-hand calcium-binding protein 1 isoform X2 n=1 Tax=Phycodurus eques TaxID=693459 RepID=UPI002ACE7627|nr:N-terminal EF-hand calcium-binding protein 1 isoform X2 [Phycodurus eques]
MMDCSEEVATVCEEPGVQADLKKGMSIFIDILRRADKNDDGKLSFDEFKAYFSDGVLTPEELKELFHAIDTHHTDNVDTDELCEYFSQHLGEYKNVLAALEDLNVSVLKAMDKTKKDYQESTHLEQFVIRFLLKETTNQLQSLQSSLECAMETTAEQTRREKQGPAKPEVLSIQWSGRRSNRRLQRNNSLSPNNPIMSLVNSGVYEEESHWTVQVNRLQKLIDRLERKVLLPSSSLLDHRSRFGFYSLFSCLQPPLTACAHSQQRGQMTNAHGDARTHMSIKWAGNMNEKNVRAEIRLEPVEDAVPESKLHILIVQRQLTVLEDELEEFRVALRNYMDAATTQTGCLHVALQRLANESRFILYEFWEHNSVWKNHLQTNYSKTFQRANVDFLETPETVTTMLLPASWWVLNNN